jgi:hypothetical protein
MPTPILMKLSERSLGNDFIFILKLKYNNYFKSMGFWGFGE